MSLPQVALFALVERGEAGAGVVGFVAEHAVEFERMTDILVDGQEQVRRIEHEVVAARLHRRRGQLLARLPRRGGGIGAHVVGLTIRDHATRQFEALRGIGREVFVAQPHRRRQAVTGAELAAGLVDGSDGERRPDPVHVLVDVGAVGAGEVLLLVDQEQPRAHEVRAFRSRGGVDVHQQRDLLLQRQPLNECSVNT